MTHRHMKKVFVIGIISILCICSACATTQTQSDNSNTSTNTGKIVGSIIGGLYGYIASGGDVKSALKYAAIGFAAGWIADTYTSKQLKSAEQARAEAIKEKKVLPKEPTLTSYDFALTPSLTLKRGDAAEVVSTIDICPSQNNTEAVVKEIIIYTAPDGTQTPVETVYKELSKGGSRIFSKKIDTQKIPQGAYSYKAALFINDKQVVTRDSSFKIVSSGNEYFAEAK